MPPNSGTLNTIGFSGLLVDANNPSVDLDIFFDAATQTNMAILMAATGFPQTTNFYTVNLATGAATLVQGPLFRLDRIADAPTVATLAEYGTEPVLAIPLQQPVTIGSEVIAPGSCGLAKSLAAIDFANDGICLISQPCK